MSPAGVSGSSLMSPSRVTLTSCPGVIVVVVVVAPFSLTTTLPPLAPEMVTLSPLRARVTPFAAVPLNVTVTSPAVQFSARLPLPLTVALSMPSARAKRAFVPRAVTLISLSARDTSSLRLFIVTVPLPSSQAPLVPAIGVTLAPAPPTRPFQRLSRSLPMLYLIFSLASAKTLSTLKSSSGVVVALRHAKYMFGSSAPLESTFQPRRS